MEPNGYARAKQIDARGGRSRKASNTTIPSAAGQTSKLGDFQMALQDFGDREVAVDIDVIAAKTKRQRRLETPKFDFRPSKRSQSVAVAGSTART